MSRGAGSKLASWLWRAPRRALGRARDLYVRSLTGCAGHLPSDAAFGHGYSYAPPLSRSRSAADDSYSYYHGFSSPAASSSSRRRSSSYGGVDDDHDLRELIRAASERRRAEQEQEQEQRPPPVVPRSQSVAMARIDEERPFEFPGAGAAAAFGRSRSVAVVGEGGRAGGGRNLRVASLA